MAWSVFLRLNRLHNHSLSCKRLKRRCDRAETNDRDPCTRCRTRGAGATCQESSATQVLRPVFTKFSLSRRSASQSPLPVPKTTSHENRQFHVVFPSFVELPSPTPGSPTCEPPSPPIISLSFTLSSTAPITSSAAFMLPQRNIFLPAAALPAAPEAPFHSATDIYPAHLEMADQNSNLVAASACSSTDMLQYHTSSGSSISSEEDPFFGAWTSETGTEISLENDPLELFGEHRWRP